MLLYRKKARFPKKTGLKGVAGFDLLLARVNTLGKQKALERETAPGPCPAAGRGRGYSFPAFWICSFILAKVTALMSCSMRQASSAAISGGTPSRVSHWVSR